MDNAAGCRENFAPRTSFISVEIRVDVGENIVRRNRKGLILSRLLELPLSTHQNPLVMLKTVQCIG